LARSDRDLGGTRVGQYSFDDRALDWVASRCASALTESPTSTGETIVFVDEIGRLELNRGAGLARLIPLLAQPRDRQVIVIVRDTLLDRLLGCVQEADPRVVVVDPLRREEAWTELSGLVFAGYGDR
jgi:nucleoside-triphosphatase THEP1